MGRRGRFPVPVGESSAVGANIQLRSTARAPIRIPPRGKAPLRRRSPSPGLTSIVPRRRSHTSSSICCFDTLSLMAAPRSRCAVCRQSPIMDCVHEASMRMLPGSCRPASRRSRQAMSTEEAYAAIPTAHRFRFQTTTLPPWRVESLQRLFALPTRAWCCGEHPRAAHAQRGGVEAHPAGLRHADREPAGAEALPEAPARDLVVKALRDQKRSRLQPEGGMQFAAQGSTARSDGEPSLPGYDSLMGHFGRAPAQQASFFDYSAPLPTFDR